MKSAFEDPSRAAELFEVVIETSPYLYCVLDSDARFTFVSPASEPMLGYAPDELIGEVAYEYVHPDDLDAAAAALTQIVEEFDLRPGEGVPMAFRLKHADGSLVDVEVGSAPMLDDPLVRGVIIRARPMSGQQFLDRALEALVASSPLEEVLEFLDASLNHELSRSHAALAYGWDGSRFTELVGGGLPDLLCGGVAGPAADLWATAMTADTMVVHPTLSALPSFVADEATALGLAALWIAPVRARPNDPAVACIGIWRDVEGDPWVSHQASLARAVRLTALAFERRHTEQLLRHAALHDTLTGVANRAQFFDRLGSLPTAEVRQHSRAAVLYLDLDGFKAVNDTYGHTAGDLVLRTVTDRMDARRGAFR
jgi:PAS domain S-box-containing protein